MKVAAIVPAAGIGRRLKSKIEKPYIRLDGVPILAHTLLVLSRYKRIDEIIVAVRKGMLDTVKKDIINRFNIRDTRLVTGGKERFNSVYNALREVSDDIDYIIIHDANRPFITDTLIDALLRLARQFGASLPAVPVRYTLKYVSKDRFVEKTPDRTRYWEAQTPQVFRKEFIMRAYNLAMRKNILATDDATLVEKIGIRPKILMGSYRNIKITTREDLELAKVLVKDKEWI